MSYTPQNFDWKELRVDLYRNTALRGMTILHVPTGLRVSRSAEDGEMLREHRTKQELLAELDSLLSERRP